MSADEYLRTILNREAVNTGVYSPVLGVQATLRPIITRWAGNYVQSITPSGSFAKGTANHSGTDVDLFISLSESTSNTLKEIYDSLFDCLRHNGYPAKHQNVSIKIGVGGYSVGLVPGKRQGIYSTDHSIYRRRADTWTKTNVVKHINYVRRAGRADETRILKVWRDQKQLDFPSFYLELTVIDALSGQFGILSDNVLKVFKYLSDSFPNARVIDPANTNNIVSDDLTAAERTKVKTAAAAALNASNWGQIVL